MRAKSESNRHWQCATWHRWHVNAQCAVLGRSVLHVRSLERLNRSLRVQNRGMWQSCGRRLALLRVLGRPNARRHVAGDNLAPAAAVSVTMVDGSPTSSSALAVPGHASGEACKVLDSDAVSDSKQSRDMQYKL